jgi:hypothetical protein
MCIGNADEETNTRKALVSTHENQPENPSTGKAQK